MSELVFLVEHALEGGFTARALGHSIFTEADTLEQLRENVKEAVSIHFDTPDETPRLIRLHIVQDELIAV